MTQKQKLIPLTSKQNKFLRGLGHHLVQSVLVGKEGLSDNLIDSCKDVLKAHELVKVKLGPNCPLHKKDAAERLALQTGSHLVQLIGKTVVLYRPNTELPGDQAIQLPLANHHCQDPTTRLTASRSSSS